jgi:hypothetical protein
MKKNLLLLIVFTLVITVTKAQNTWINYKIDSKLSIKVPNEPKQIDENSVLASDNDGAAYIITIADFQKLAGLDSAKIAPMANTPDFASSLRTGMLSKMPGYTLGDVKIGTWHGYVCYNVEGGNDASKIKVYTFMILIASKLYGLSVVVPDSLAFTGKDDFFASVALN